MLTPFLAALTTMCGLTGLVAVVSGSLGRLPAIGGPGPTARLPRWLARRARQPLTSADRPAQVRIAIALGVGSVTWLATGWLIVALLLVTATWGLPLLLRSSTARHEIARLEAMSDWAQSLSSMLGVGIGIEQAIAASLHSAPEPIRPEIARLVARLRARWNTVAALRALADDLDDATGDLLVAALILGADRRGAQLTSVLEGMAAAVRDDVQLRRNVDAEQAKGRTTVRLVTAIGSAVLGLMLMSPLAQPYRTASGQVILGILVACYVGCLVWMRRATATPRRPRILVGDL